MERLSSKLTSFSKRAVPVFLIVGVAVTIFGAVVVSRTHPVIPMIVLLAPLLAFSVAYLVMRKLVFDLVDEVWDGGDFLLVRNKGEEDRVPFDHIMNLSYTMFGNNRRATLKLRTPCRFGRDVSFMPTAPMFSLSFGKNKMLEELIERIDAKRRGGP